MTLVFSDPLFERHQTGFHPECAARVQGAARYLDGLPWFSQLARGRITAATEELIVRTHSQHLIDQARTLAAGGGGYLDADTYLSPASFDVALHAAGTAMHAVDQVLRAGAEHREAFCLMRPPGHHATAQLSMGFCVFNNIAIAAHYARDVYGLQRILIVDFDVHHGNGTQDIFYEDAGVYFFSIHRFPFYPGSGTADETGRGRGLGTTLNIPLSMGTSRQLYREAFQRGLDTAVERCRPELILISAGFDAHKDDPVGSLGLEIEDYDFMTRSIKQAAASVCDGRIVSCLEGGYNLEVLPLLVAAHLEALRR